MHKLFIFLLIFLIMVDIIFANTIELNLQQNYFDIFYPSSIDKDHPEAQPFIFALTVSNNDTIPRGCKLAVSFSSNNYGTLLTKEDGVIKNYLDLGSSENDSLLMQAGYISTYTNKNLLNKNINIEGDWDDIIDGNKEFEDLVLESGFLPTDTYTFTIYALKPDDPVNFNNVYDEVQAVFHITNPNNINLIYPGEPFSFNPPDIIGNLPVFSWFSNTNQHTLEIYEVNESEYIDEIINKEPYYEKANINTNIFAYPQQAPELISNNIYAWRVIAQVQTSLNQVKIESDLWCFRIQGADIGDNNASGIEHLINYLNETDIIDIEQLDISNFNPTGKYYINGEEVNYNELLNFISEILSGKYSVEKTELE